MELIKNVVSGGLGPIHSGALGHRQPHRVVSALKQSGRTALLCIDQSLTPGVGGGEGRHCTVSQGRQFPLAEGNSGKKE